MRNSDFIEFNKDALGTDEDSGMLKLMAHISRTGVFVYQKVRPDGTIEILRQLRHPEDVFEDESMASLVGLPVTNEHPSVAVTSENAEDFIVGMSSNVPKKIFAPVQGDSEDYIEQLVTFFNKDTIEEITTGKKSELSLGYNLDLEECAGLWNGVPYNCRQRNIKYNHLSLVKRGRGGRSVKLVLDGEDTEIEVSGEIFVEDGEQSSFDNNNGGEEMKIFNHDGKEFKVEDDVFSLLNKFAGNLDSSSLELLAKSKDSDKLQAQCDDLTAKLKVQTDTDDAAEVRKLVKERVALEKSASAVLGTKVALDSLSDREVKELVIKKSHEGLNLDSKSVDYVDARYDLVVESFNADESVENEDEKKMGGDVSNTDSSNEDKVAAARKKAWDTAKELYKN